MTLSGITRTLVAVAATTALTVTAAPGHAGVVTPEDERH